MRKLIILVFVLFLVVQTSCSQTTKNVHTFPEDYIGKVITFKNIRYWPILFENNGYYTVQIDISPSLYSEREWGFQTFNKVVGVVEKNIAKQMIIKDIGGYNTFYYGALTGKVIKSKKVFGSDYLFVISKVINHPPDEPNKIIHKFQKLK